MFIDLRVLSLSVLNVSFNLFNLIIDNCGFIFEVLSLDIGERTHSLFLINMEFDVNGSIQFNFDLFYLSVFCRE